MFSAGIKIKFTLTNHIRGSRREKSILKFSNICCTINISKPKEYNTTSNIYLKKLENSDKLTLCPNYNLDKINDYTITDNYDTNIQNKVTKYIKLFL